MSHQDSFCLGYSNCFSPKWLQIQSLSHHTNPHWIVSPSACHIEIKLLEIGYDEFKDRDGFIWTHLIGSFWSIYIDGLTCTHLKTWTQPDSFIFIYIYIYWLELTWTDIHLDSWTHTWTHHNSFTIITHPIYIKQTQLTIYNYHHDSQIEN